MRSIMGFACAMLALACYAADVVVGRSNTLFHEFRSTAARKCLCLSYRQGRRIAMAVGTQPRVQGGGAAEGAESATRSAKRRTFSSEDRLNPNTSATAAKSVPRWRA